MKVALKPLQILHLQKLNVLMTLLITITAKYTQTEVATAYKEAYALAAIKLGVMANNVVTENVKAKNYICP